MEMTVIIGGSGSGKSSFAEQYFIEHVKTNRRYYIATMQIYGEEGKQKVERSILHCDNADLWRRR